MPSLMKQDQPVNVTARQLDYDGDAGVATYTGTARLWQDQTQIQGDTIVLDDRSGNLTARGHVSSVMFFDQTDTKTKKKKPVQTTASAEELVYLDAKRLATYTSGPNTKAHLVGTEGDITAEQIQLFLKESGGEPWPVSVYLVGMALVTVVAVLLAAETKHRDLDDEGTRTVEEPADEESW